LTGNRPRVSYRIQAIFWNSGGETWRRKHCLYAASNETGFRIRVLGVSRVEQEADGSWVKRPVGGRLIGFQPAARSNRVIHRTVWPERGPGRGNGPEAPSPFPETNFQVAGLKPVKPVP
jgi:hypothetical protein